MDDLQKAAQLLKHLSMADRTQILSQVDETQRTALEAQIENVPEVSQSELVGIVAEYQNWLRHLQSIETSEKPAKSHAEDVQYLTNSRDLVRLTELLATEPGTVQAAVMCHIEEESARQIFHSLTDQQQAELVERLPEQRGLSSLVWDELSLYLNEIEPTQNTSPKRGQQLLTRLISNTDVDAVSEGRLVPGEQELVERMKR
jgi:flagellar motor switch protein FliG